MLKLELICSYIFYHLRLKPVHQLLLYADAKVILNVRMIESDISPIASEWADALLRKVGCQVSALITRWGWLRGVGRLVAGNSLCVYSL